MYVMLIKLRLQQFYRTDCINFMDYSIFFCFLNSPVMGGGSTTVDGPKKDGMSLDVVTDTLAPAIGLCWVVFNKLKCEAELRPLVVVEELPPPLFTLTAALAIEGPAPCKGGLCKCC
uniref:Uncharacterized protein n=1 Tax=Glossina pallidipes TaxID=7398 RepID=A0A1A9ZXY3_GLOPL